MKQFMVVVTTEDGVFRQFYDTYGEAEDARMNAECGMGYHAEVWQKVAGKYQFLYC